MSLTISWTIEGSKDLSRTLRGVSLEMKEWKQALTNSARLLTGVFSNDVFQTRGGIIKRPWKPLSPATLRRKATSEPLIETGRMKRSFQYTVSQDAAVIYNPTPYFKYHQSNQPRRRLPRRVMMRLAERQREQVVKEFQRVFIAKLKRAHG